MTCIGVTGANGFLGNALCRTFSQRGAAVVALARRPGADAFPLRRFDLAAPIEPELLAGIDVLVHAAYDVRPAHAAENEAGTRRLFEAARSAGVGRIVLVSSMAAQDGSASSYGRNKRAAERLLDPGTDLIVRPGLVVGEGGLFASMWRSLLRYRIAPVFSGGRQPVYTVGLTDLCEAVYALIAGGHRGIYTIANAQPVCLADLYRALAARAGRRIVLVPLPLGATLAAVSLAERWGLRLPLDSERLRGLANLHRQSVSLDIPGIGEPAPFAAALEAVQFS